MIEAIRKFLERFKTVCDSHTNCYTNESPTFIGWSSLDFDTSKISEEMSKTRQVLAYGQAKKMYDVVRTYKRTYMVYNKSREDYYRDALYERDRDKFILDKIVTTAVTNYSTYSEKS